MHTFLESIDFPCQSVVLDIDLLEAYVPTKVDMRAFKEDNLLAKLNEVEGEEIDISNMLSKISSLEKSQGDILTML